MSVNQTYHFKHHFKFEAEFFDGLAKLTTSNAQLRQSSCTTHSTYAIQCRKPQIFTSTFIYVAISVEFI